MLTVLCPMRPTPLENLILTPRTMKHVLEKDALLCRNHARGKKFTVSVVGLEPFVVYPSKENGKTQK